MSEPIRRSAPGEGAALARVEVLLERIDTLQLEQFAPSILDVPEPDEHARLVEALEATADRSGRRALLDEVRGRVRHVLEVHMAQPRRYDPIGRYPLSPSRPDDVALALVTVVDAVSVAVMEDRLPVDLAVRLSTPGRALLGLPPLGDDEAAPSRPAVGAPSAEDWAEAADGATAIGHRADADADAATPSVMPVVDGRTVLAIALACTLGPLAILGGVVGGTTGLGVLVGLAVVVLCWLLATYRR